MPMDAIFGFAIILNGAFIGVQQSVHDDSAKHILWFIDNVFVILFIIEFILRAMLNATLEDLKDGTQSLGDNANKSGSKALEDVKDQLKFGLFPRCPKGGCNSVCRHLPKMLSDVGTIFDALVILSTIVDTW